MTTITQLRETSTGTLAPLHLLGTDTTGRRLAALPQGWAPADARGSEVEDYRQDADGLLILDGPFCRIEGCPCHVSPSAPTTYPLCVEHEREWDSDVQGALDRPVELMGNEARATAHILGTRSAYGR